MKLMVEDKQVGSLTYFVNSLNVLHEIIKTGKIAHSRVKEFNFNKNRMQYCVCMSRSFEDAPKRNPKRWRFGVIIDGNFLSNKYEITPVSCTGVTFQKSGLKVKCLTAYDNDTYTIQFSNWKSLSISENIFNSIKMEILAMSESEKERCGLTIQTVGKRTVNGRKIVEKYTFTVRFEGLTLDASKYPELTSYISKFPSINEFEERIWVTNSQFIEIKGAIIGVVIPENLTDDEYDYFSMYVKPTLDLKHIDFVYTY